MPEAIADIAFTDTVKRAQTARGSRENYEKHIAKRDWESTVTPDLAAFIAERNSFYMASANADGQPYIQHRGGKKGFLKVLGERTLGFADYAGNRQYISLGNLEDNDRAYIFLMDYANRRRIKVWGRARVVEGDDGLLDQVRDPDYRARPERVIVFDITAWDVNCPQHIPVLLDEEAVADREAALRGRIAELEEENERLTAAAIG